ncbi:hypothetical protein ACFWBI_07750 [Streptomyces sp. NPDC059982]|uniref:hypothetical protein n=1 Tax=unclassified Streptomyces TaxID=2593676 RepID=UPI0036D06DAD
MSSAQREREKWREKRDQERKALRVFSSAKPLQRPEGKRIRHPKATWDMIPADTFRMNNTAMGAAWTR